MNEGTRLAHIFSHAAVLVMKGYHIGYAGALRTACKDIYKDDPNTYTYYRSALTMCHTLMGPIQLSYVGGYGRGMWLTENEKSLLCMSLLMCYEYCVVDLQGERSEFLNCNAV